MGKIFDEVNEKVFNTNTDYEELQGLCIDLATKLEKAEQQASQLEPLVSLPCPFCANTKIRTWQTEDEYWHIQCNSDVCGACMDDFTTEQEAIKQWNVRSN